MFYSAETNTFHDPALADPPAGSIEISAARHRALLGSQAGGQMIVAGPDGLPIAVDRPVPSPAEALAAWRASALLSDVQLLIGLVAERWISEAEGAMWRDGTLPPQVVALIDTLPEEQRFGASVRALRGRRIERLDPLVEAMAAAQDKSPAELDLFFQTYSQI